MVKPFPQVQLNKDINGLDANPAVRLYGRRFFTDQTTLELLIEMLSIFFSPKRIVGVQNEILTELPSIDTLDKKWDKSLEYAPKARLNLKLFSFFGASRIDSRHETHRQHLQELDESLRKLIESGEQFGKDFQDKVIRTIENMFLGFYGVGAQRTWCAQEFMPLCPELIACESIWRASKGKKSSSWEESIGYFSHTQNQFLARGGEVLYLQICNALGRAQEEITKWMCGSGVRGFLTPNEQSKIQVYDELSKALKSLFNETPVAISKISEFVDCMVEQHTAERTGFDPKKNRWITAGWCPEETWPEGYLFAVELLRICRARLDIMTRLELLETACTLQVMRTLCTQASRYSKETKTGNGAWPSYYWAISDPEGSDPASKRISRESVQASCKMIYDALRHPEILDATPSPSEPLYADADRRYGHKLFLSLGKRIGMIVPRRGAGARFVLNERLLRFLVVALVPSRRITFDSFKERARGHFGLVFDSVSLEKANVWATGIKAETLNRESDEWLAEMLEESGSFRRLSDSCALVENLASDDGQGD